MILSECGTLDDKITGLRLENCNLRPADLFEHVLFIIQIRMSTMVICLTT